MYKNCTSILILYFIGSLNHITLVSTLGKFRTVLRKFNTTSSIKRVILRENNNHSQRYCKSYSSSVVVTAQCYLFQVPITRNNSKCASLATYSWERKVPYVATTSPKQNGTYCELLIHFMKQKYNSSTWWNRFAWRFTCVRNNIASTFHSVEVGLSIQWNFARIFIWSTDKLTKSLNVHVTCSKRFLPLSIKTAKVFCCFMLYHKPVQCFYMFQFN